MHCSKCQLQSLLGQLLYVHKCVLPAHIFLNHMLELLRRNHDQKCISLMHSFKCDVRWFDSFLTCYNDVSMYNHRRVDHQVVLDACLERMGAVWNNYVYHLPIPCHYLNLSIVHLEMVNILVSLKVFGPFWRGCKILIHCDNQEVVPVLNSGRTKDAFLACCAQNIWQMAAIHDVHFAYQHIMGVNNCAVDLLSRWKGTTENIARLQKRVQDLLWLQVDAALLEVDGEI